MNFLSSFSLWENIVGGIVAALFIYLFFHMIERRKNRIMNELIEIMGKAIVHRNSGESKTFSDEDEWIEEAKDITNEAVEKAKELSGTAGSLVEWLDRIDPWSSDSELEKYVSILSKVVERIRGLMERKS